MELETEELTASQDNDVVSKVQLCVVIVILAILCVTGTAGNALVLYVFARKRDKHVSTLFMIVLALVDFVTCLVIMPLTIYMEYFDFRVTSDPLCKVYQFLITSTIPFSALIMVAIAVDRYLSICHPFLQALNPPRAKAVIGCLAILAAGLGICVSLMFSVYLQAVTNFTHVTGVSEWGHSVEVTRSPVVVDLVVALHGRVLPEASTVSLLWETRNWTADDQQQQSVLVNMGWCKATDRVISGEFQFYYQKFYNTMFVVCLVIVVVLYTLIYRSVLARRERRQSQKSQALPLVVSLRGNSCSTQTTVEIKLKIQDEALLITDESRLTGSDEDPAALPLNGSRTPRKRGFSLLKGNSRRKKVMLDASRMANLKTAVMLFVVTVTFIVTFAPAFLMAMDIIPYNMIVFYLYFANNVANPVIYSFMNNNFRQDLRKLFTATCRSTGHL